MNRSTSTPPIVNLLGYGGLIPFIGLAILSFTSLIPKEIARTALIYYAVTILSFVAALHWGFAMTLKTLSKQQTSRLYIWSVIPPLVAWVSLFLPMVFGVSLLIAGFISHLWQDLLIYKVKSEEIPSWYIPLRVRLTTIATLSLASLLLQP